MRCSLVLVLCFTSIGFAQSDDAAAAFARGSAAFEEERYEVALTEFRRAYELAPHDAVRGSIGRCLERLGRFEDALLEYEAVAASEQVPEADRAHARELSSRVRARLSALEARAEGSEPDEGEVDVPFEIAETDDTNETSTDEPSPSFWLTATSSVVAVGATSAAIGLGLRGQAIEDDYMAGPTQSLLDQGRRFQRTTNAMWGVAITAVVVTVVDLIVRLSR